ncbi:hypothetical protein OEV98_11575 [Caldibacillus lycopersici]|uniref:Uncharacterized protein n=1 Tax=Perspicuibacillus lycopersici TaxID=1325689 RepID=A0AAE3LNS3_9BACI|nr:hypothetical protein [Perspicuibacillus lycopersici]MCU9614201.1 hypothetical protein [Perspicuibacillus lycopersici]
MKNRCLLSLLICGVMLYYALPNLTLRGSGLDMYFSWGWLLFLLLAVAGNLAAVLYVPKRQKQNVKSIGAKTKIRSYQN